MGLAAVGHDGMLLARLAESLRADKAVVFMAVQSCGRALQYAPEVMNEGRKELMTFFIAFFLSLFI